MEASESTIPRLSGWMLWPLLVVSPASGAEDEAPPVLDPVEITVTAPRLATPLADLPAAVSRVDDRQATEGRQGLQLDEALNRVPGLFGQNRYNFAQDARISIRGFGSRAPFGVRGLRILQDGVPETTPDGQSQVDAIDLLNLRDIEVLRGPSAALYGNASGGVIAARTRDGRDPRGFGGGVLLGSYGYRRAEAVAEQDHGTHRYSLTAHDFAIDGYREQSTAEKRYLRLHTASELDAGTLNVHLRYLDAPRTDDPGGLTREEMREDRRAAAPLATALDSTQSAEQLTTGLQWEQPLAGGELRLGGFWTQRDYAQQLPFPGDSRVAYERDFFGVNAQYERDVGATRVLTGIDLEEQRDDRTRRCSAGRLFDRDGGECSADPVDPMSDLALDQRERARSRGVFVQTDTALGSDWNLVAGARHDRIRMSIDDHFVERFDDGDDVTDRSGRRTFDETSGMAGLIWHFRPEYRAYVNVATNFETPTFTEFANPEGGGGFNPEVDPQRARSIEVGIRRENPQLSWEASVYATRVRDELSPYQLEGQGDRTFYTNAGRTARDGVELSADWRLNPQWTLSAAASLNRFRFREFEDAEGVRHDGNRMPGLPREQLFVEADWRDGPWFVTVDALHVGSRYVDNANTEKVGPQTTLNLRAGRFWQQGDTRAEAFVAANNLLDADNVDNIRINAAGGRYYEPAPGLTLMAGVRMYFGQ
ncbi:TonB-dependent receptor family protein [Thioalkalivibrio sp. AKL8]|uniref:TonB-dependent receptor family protein n=1 Tax=Thioalkalivibrio TaxID=106633 RepID=UPI00037F8A56|nr:TonB-dependent receptor [Thioalkalivibrio versutus]